MTHLGCGENPYIPWNKTEIALSFAASADFKES